MRPMNGRVRTVVAGAIGSLMLLAAGAGPALARDVVVTSPDGTQIVTTFLPAEGLAPGQRAPTVMQTHGLGMSRTTDPNEESSDITGNVGSGPL